MFWLTANRLKVLNQALHTTVLPAEAVHEIFRLNPPVLHVFQVDNLARFSPATGVNVFLINWAVFFGNSMALTWSSALQQGAYFGQFSPWLLTAYLLLIVAVIAYGSRTIIPEMRNILGTLHDVDFRLGWHRHVAALTLAAAVFVVGQWDQVKSPGPQDGDLLGPAIANAIDGETLFVGGTEVKLFGIDTVEADQVCQDGSGADYPCGRRATRALQSIVQQDLVVCLPLFAIGDSRLVGNCEVGVRRRVPAGLSHRFHGGNPPEQPVTPDGGPGARGRHRSRHPLLRRPAAGSPGPAPGHLARILSAAQQLAPTVEEPLTDIRAETRDTRFPPRRVPVRSGDRPSSAPGAGPHPW